MKVAIVYDRVNKWGGAERVLLTLHEMFPKAPLFTSVYDQKNAPWARVFRVVPSFLQHIPFVKSHHELFPFLMPFAFASFSFKKYDLVISVTSEFAKGITTKGKTKHLCICLTPTRYLWSGYNDYFKNTYTRFFTKPLVGILRWYDKKISQNPHAYIAISQEVQKRIQTYYKKNAIVIYPPTTKLKKTKRNIFFENDYFLVVSRLSKFTTYKKIEIAIQAATSLSASLIVVGDGDISYFKKFAGPTVHFTKKISDEQLAWYYQHARALIFPGKEDFGLVMVEALSYGKPVIAFKGGGALEIVTDKKTGMFFSSQTTTGLVKVLKTFKASTYNSNVCRKSVEKFSEKAFRLGIQKVIKGL